MDIPKANKSKKKDNSASHELNEKRRKELEAIILNFLKSNEKTTKFSTKLNAFERFLIHEIATQNGLIHQSQGEGEERYIMLIKQNDEADGSQECTQKECEENKKVYDKYSTKENNLLNQKDNVKNQRKRKKDKKKEFTEEDRNKIETANCDLLGNEKEEIYEVEMEPQKDQIKHQESLTLNQNINNDSFKQLSSDLAPSNVEKKPSKKVNKEKEQTELSKPQIKKQCDICSSEILCRNFDLHLLRCEKLRKEKKIKEEINKRQVRNIFIEQTQLPCN